jgi:hypothetical protein
MGVKDSCTLLVMWETVAACPVDKGCVFGDSDFSSLHHSDYYEVVADAGQKYLLNLCGPVRSGACGDIDDVTACEVGKNNSLTVIGQLDGHHVQMSDSTGIALFYKTSNTGVQHVESVAIVQSFTGTSVCPTVLTVIAILADRPVILPYLPFSRS